MNSLPSRFIARTLTIGALLSAMLAGPACAGEAKSSALADPYWHHGAFMEIFVRAYQDSDGDGIGDLKGLTSRLDYLQDLGIRGIWLMPVQRSADRDHGYATSDYREIEADYGSMDDFRELLKQAHARGIGIITDYVINHSAQSHPFFEASRKDPASPYRAWYVWEEFKQPGWDIWGKNPWTQTDNGAYLATFGPAMPDFNLRNPEVVNYHFDTLRYFLDMGIDGFRLDAVPHMIENNAKEWQDQPESRALAKQMQDLVNEYPHRYVVCEATADPIGYSKPEVCGSAFAFGWQFPVANAAMGQRKEIRKLAQWFTKAPLSMGTFVSNHDTFAGQRLWDQVKGDEAVYKLAAATYLLHAGRPYIYYGEEIGMGGATQLGGDAILRSPMGWTADPVTGGFTTGAPFRPLPPNLKTHNAQAQARDPASIHAFYKTMLKLRNTRPSIARGDYVQPVVSDRVMHYRRVLGDETTVVAFNYGRTAASAKLSHLPPGARLTPLFPADARPVVVNAQGRAAVPLQRRTVSVYSLTSN